MWFNSEWGEYDHELARRVQSMRLAITESAFIASEHWLALVKRFQTRLLAGELVARAYTAPVGPSDRRETIPAEMWGFLELDEKSGAARGHGLEFVSIRISEAISKARSTAKAESQCHDWLRDHAEEIFGLATPFNKSTVFELAKDQPFGANLSKHSFTKAWDKAPPPPPDWKKPGRKPKPVNS